MVGGLFFFVHEDNIRTTDKTVSFKKNVMLFILDNFEMVSWIFKFGYIYKEKT